jgi:hypothetical protein
LIPDGLKEAFMAISKNVGKGERVARIILGAILIPAGFSLADLWKIEQDAGIMIGCVITLTVGVCLILTSLVGY